MAAIFEDEEKIALYKESIENFIKNKGDIKYV